MYTNQRFAFFIACIIILSPLKSQSDHKAFVSRSFKASTGHTLPYRLAMPSEIKEQKLPLLIFLHGGGERGTDNEQQLTHGASFLLRAVKDHGAIVVAPQCHQDSYWSSVNLDRSTHPITLTFDYKQKDATPDLMAVAELIKSLQGQYAIDKRRIYIIGMSMGGMGTFELVHRCPKIFAAAVSICGGGDSINYTRKAHNKVAFWILHGDSDVVVDVVESRRMVSALKRLKYDVKYTEYPGVNHNSWDNAFQEPELLTWLFGHYR